MNVPRWVDEVGQLFPRQAKEVMERELINRKGLRETAPITDTRPITEKQLKKLRFTATITDSTPIARRI